MQGAMNAPAKTLNNLNVSWHDSFHDATHPTNMCLYPRFIRNKKYLMYNTKAPKRSAASTIPIDDYRKQYVAIGCGECIECRKQKAQQWRVRLCEEIKVNKYAYFITLTFSNESLQELCNFTEQPESNAVATLAVRRFLERYRKKYKVSLKHWLITELGHENTERIHLHGIIFRDEPITNDELQSIWKYGKSDIGEYCNVQTINYIVKYVTKIDTDHKNFKAAILCSAGLGEAYVKTHEAQNKYKYIKGSSNEAYTLPNGAKVALPIYYRNKLYTEEERQNLWTDRLDKDEIYVRGIKIRNISSDEGQKEYYELLKNQQRENKMLGYGDTSKEWEKESYNITFKMLQKAKKR